MKKLLLIAVLFLAITISCDKPGVTEMKLTGVEQQLPEELKGLKVYTVSIGEGQYVKVAILNSEVNSVTYQEGKTTSTTIIINKGEYNEKTIYCKEILAETKDIIVIKKQ
jgi:hypothetical protein